MCDRQLILMSVNIHCVWLSIISMDQRRCMCHELVPQCQVAAKLNGNLCVPGTWKTWTYVSATNKLDTLNFKPMLARVVGLDWLMIPLLYKNGETKLRFRFFFVSCGTVVRLFTVVIAIAMSTWWIENKLLYFNLVVLKQNKVVVVLVVGIPACHAGTRVRSPATAPICFFLCCQVFVWFLLFSSSRRVIEPYVSLPKVDAKETLVHFIFPRPLGIRSNIYSRNSVETSLF